MSTITSGAEAPTAINITFDDIQRNAYRWPDATTYATIKQRLEREAQGLPAIPPPPPPPSPRLCLRCDEQRPVNTARGSYGYLCAECEEEEKKECEAKRLEAEANKPLPTWPTCWPSRPILDLARFDGVPLEKAVAVEKKLADGGMVALIGDRGRGKTVMAAWLGNERRKRRETPGIYMRAHDLFEAIRDTYNTQPARPRKTMSLNEIEEREDEGPLVAKFRETPFLVIDEIQERGETDWENRTLVNILDHRHAEILPTLLIGNVTAAELNKNLGPSILDRMTEQGAVVECAWENFRAAKKPVYSDEELAAIPWSRLRYSSKGSEVYFRQKPGEIPTDVTFDKIRIF